MVRSLFAASVVWMLLIHVGSAQERSGEPPARGGRGSGMRGGMGRGGTTGGLRGMGQAFMGQTAQEQAKLPVPPQEELNKKFSEMLSGATLEGVYTLDGGPSDQAPRPDKYTIDKVTKLPETDLWQFEATVAVGGRGMSMPITVAVKWAGDTPMIQLTSTAIQGMGTYSTRIFFYEDQYAGTWKHGPASGLMYGRIVKTDKKEEKPAAQ